MSGTGGWLFDTDAVCESFFFCAVLRLASTVDHLGNRFKYDLSDDDDVLLKSRHLSRAANASFHGVGPSLVLLINCDFEGLKHKPHSLAKDSQTESMKRRTEAQGASSTTSSTYVGKSPNKVMSPKTFRLEFDKQHVQKDSKKNWRENPSSLANTIGNSKGS